jgi:hypothetical protein
MSRFSPHVALLVIVLSLLRPVSSIAESSSGKTISGSTAQLLESANAAITAGDYPAAYQALVTAYPQAPAESRYHLGRLAAAEGQAVAARDLLRRFLADQNVDPADPLRAAAQKLLDSLPLREAGEVSVGAPRGAQILLDGRLVGTLPLLLPLLVATGVHRLQVSQGRWRAETEFQVRTARTVEVRFKSGSDLAVVTRPAAVLYCEQQEGELATAGESLGHVVETAVKHENYSLLSRQAALSFAPDIAACEPPPANTLSATEALHACCAALAQRFGIERILDARLTLAGQDFGAELGLRETEVDGAGPAEKLSCSGCAAKELGQRLTDGISKLFAQADKQGRGNLQVTATPVASEVFLAGRPVGVTPYSRKVWAGSYPLEVRRPGHITSAQTVEVTADQPATLTVELPAEQALVIPVPKAPPRRPLWRIGAGAAGIAAGALMLGFGISAFSVNGACSLDRLPACDGIYRTSAVGGALVGVGSALMIGGAVLIALPPPK